MIRIVAGGLLAGLFVLTTAARARSVDELPYDSLAAELRERYGVEDSDRGNLDFGRMLTENSLHAQVGLFRVHVFTGAVDRKAPGEDFEAMCLALLDAQEVWLDWLEPATPAPDAHAAARKDLATLRSWVKSWRGGVLVKEAQEGGQDLLDALNAKDKVREASDRLADTMGRGTLLGLERESQLQTILLVPDRASFTRLLCFAGWMRDEWRDIFWVPEILDWTESFIEDVKVIALEYPSVGRAAGDFGAGTSMNENTASGMAQQVVQLGMNTLFENQYGDRIPEAFAGGLALNVVVDVYDEARTRVDGDLRSKKTHAREVFVPGGQSEGGVLPSVSADSRWRSEHGKDRFTRTLRASQKNGASMSKGAKDKVSHFRLKADDGVQNAVIHGPFLGTPAMDFELPKREFLGDYVEFLRSYRCGFTYWMRTGTTRKKKEALASFSTLLVRLASIDGIDGFEPVFEEVYERPLSSGELGPDSLEGSFLTWLSKQ